MRKSNGPGEFEPLHAAYRERYSQILLPLSVRLERHIREILKDTPRVDRIAARAKAVSRFMEKAQSVKKEYSDPLIQIQDQVGARIVVFYLRDVDAVAETIQRVFRSIESKAVLPDRESEFGYFGRHFILFIPTELFDDDVPQVSSPQFFELQIKTLYQHAWAEANHDLAYKPIEELSADDRRKIAFTAAQSWGADSIFDELSRRLVHHGN